MNLDGVQFSRIENNLLYGNHASGISFFRIDGAEGSQDNIVVNNTVVQAADGRWALNIQNESTGNTLFNNILYNYHSFRGSMDVSSDSLPGLESDFNIVMERFTTDGGESLLSLAQWQAATGQDLHLIVAVPAEVFVSEEENDYRLSATSAAIDVGTSSLAPDHDIENHSRPIGAGFDIGAYEASLLTGDVNGDGQVNGLDVDPFIDVLLNGPYRLTADMNADGVIDGQDVAGFVGAVQNGVSTQLVPEPATVWLTAIGLLCVLWLRKTAG